MKYLAILPLLFLVGCATTSGGGSSVGAGRHGSYQDYSYTDANGNVKIHRVYSDSHQEWLDQAAAAK